MATSSRPASKTLGQFVWSNPGSTRPHESLSTALADMVARCRGVDPLDEEFRLFDYLDPDAVDDLYEHARRHPATEWRLECNLGDQRLEVRSDGVVRIDASDGSA